MTAGSAASRDDGRFPPPRELPFVGREATLGALVSAVQAAELGESVHGLVAGEPGIGKTRLVREMATRVSASVLWAGTWVGDGAPPYWVWLQLLRALSLEASGAAGAEHLIQSMQGGAASADVSGDARFRMFDAVTEVFSAASHQRPLVLVIEDLHWADESSVRLLEFFFHDRRPRRVAVVCTYRETDLGANHPLARHLGELVRDGLHVSLGGLGKRDVAALVTAMGEEASLQRMVPLLHRKSGGNPLFLRELVRLWHDEGRLDCASSDLASAVPAGVRPVVALRVGRLAPSTQEVLAAAAVVGTDFGVSMLGAVTATPAGALLQALDESRAAGLVVETGDGGAFRFVHALVREALYEQLGLPARAALHDRIAGVLEERFGEARLPEIAHHVLRGSGAGGHDRAVDLGMRAGEQSFEVLAYEEAARWYRRAFDALQTDHRADPRATELLLRRGDAELAAGDIPAAKEAYRAAAVLAKARGDADQLARAALGLGAGFGGFEVQLLDPLQVDLLKDALRALDPGPSPLRAWVLARLSVALSFMGAESRRRSLSDQAVAMARELDDPRVLGYALAGHCDAIPAPEHCEARLSEAAEVVRLAQAAGDRPLELLGRRLRLVALIEVGDIGEVDADIERFAHIADQLRQPLYRWYVPLWRGMRCLMQGDLDAAARHCAAAEEIGALAHSANARMLTFTQWWVRRRYEGGFAEVGQAVADLIEPGDGTHALTPAGWPYPAVVAAGLGELDRARALLEHWLATGLENRPRDSEWLPDSAQLVQVAVLVGCREVAELLYEQLRPHAGRFCVEGIGGAFTGSVAWYLALAGRFLGRVEEADAYARQASVAHRRVGLVGDPPPIAGPASASPPRPTLSPAEGTASMVWEGATWAVGYAGATCRLRDSKGVRDLAVLLVRPGQDVHCLELMGGGDVGSAPGPVLDQQARRAYERRIRDLQGDIDDARAANDPARAERAEAELDALVQQLSEAFGLSGRTRSTGSAAERARSAVGWRLRAAVRHAAQAHPALGRHLENAVRTGTWCSYRPETVVIWVVDPRHGRRA